MSSISHQCIYQKLFFSNYECVQSGPCITGVGGAYSAAELPGQAAAAVARGGGSLPQHFD